MSKTKIGDIEFVKRKGFDKKYKVHYRELQTDISEDRYVTFREFNSIVNVTPQGQSWIRMIVEVFNKENNGSTGAMYLEKSQSVDAIKNIVKQLKEDPKKLG